MNSKTIILVPVASHIEPGCDESLRKLETQGYCVNRVFGNPDIARVRSIMAAEAVADGFENLFWIDSDILFNPDDVSRLIQYGLPVVGAIYSKKADPAFACKCLPGEHSVTFGESGGLFEVQYLATGFLLTHRCVYEAMRALLPRCFHERKGVELYPYFAHEYADASCGKLFLTEDYSFCERARRCQFKIMADTSVRLGHLGLYAYSWEDVHTPRQRLSRVDFKICQE